jgi:hypothetical protein
MDYKEYTVKMAKALAEFKFCHLGKYFYGIVTTVMRFHYVRYCTLSEVRDYWRNTEDWYAQ